MKLEWSDRLFDDRPCMATELAGLLFVVYWRDDGQHDIYVYKLPAGRNLPHDLRDRSQHIIDTISCDFPHHAAASGAGAAIYNYIADEAKRMRNRAAELEALL